MNIILVIFDSLRKDCTGVYGSSPWGRVQTPHFDALAQESLVMTRAFPESLPTLPTRRAVYTGQRVYPFHNADFRLKGDFRGAPGWGPIPEEQDTLAEILQDAGYRTGLISDVYHMFKASKNFSRGFDQWTFLRGQETDPSRSGPRLTRAELDYWFPEEMRVKGMGNKIVGAVEEFVQRCVMNYYGRKSEEEYFAPRVLKEAGIWLEQNQDADKFFLTIESFDPHEPWLPPIHYRKMYDAEEGPEQIISAYGEVGEMSESLLTRTRANYSGEVTMCDRWFGHFVETMRVLGLLDNTLLIFTSDHGHSLGDRDYMGKRGYPSSPEVYDIPLMVRFPQAQHAGKTSDMLVQHHDITAAILAAAGVEPPQPIDGISFLDDAINGRAGQRDHATVAWGSALTVITREWWLNCKADGTGVLLHDLKAADPFDTNVADEHASVVQNLFDLAKADAKGGIPDWVIELARNQADAPGCSDLACRV